MRFFKRNPKLFTPKDFDYSPYFNIIKYPFIGLDELGIYRSLPWAETALLYNDEAGGFDPEHALTMVEDGQRRLAERKDDAVREGGPGIRAGEREPREQSKGRGSDVNYRSALPRILQKYGLDLSFLKRIY